MSAPLLRGPPLRAHSVLHTLYKYEGARTMYAVIKTGGKQYRVQPGDVLVVEKLDGQPGADVSFGEVLMLGDGDAVSVGAPTIAGASVTATFIETRKGEKVKI